MSSNKLVNSQHLWLRINRHVLEPVRIDTKKQINKFTLTEDEVKYIKHYFVSLASSNEIQTRNSLKNLKKIIEHRADKEQLYEVLEIRKKMRRDEKMLRTACATLMPRPMTGQHMVDLFPDYIRDHIWKREEYPNRVLSPFHSITNATTANRFKLAWAENAMDTLTYYIARKQLGL